MAKSQKAYGTMAGDQPQQQPESVASSNQLGKEQCGLPPLYFLFRFLLMLSFCLECHVARRTARKFVVKRQQSPSFFAIASFILQALPQIGFL